MFGFKKKANKENSRQFKIVVHQPQQKHEKLSIDVLDEASNELLLSESIEQSPPLQQSVSKIENEQRIITPPPAVNIETERLAKEVEEMRKTLAEYGIEKMKEHQRALQFQNADLENMISAKQSLVTELEHKLQLMKDAAIDGFRQNIDAYERKFITDFINKVNV